MMRVVFCGSGPFAVASLKAILACRHEVAGVFTQPARPGGRGRHVRATPLAQAAGEQRLPVIECRDINAEESLQPLRALQADAMVVADFGQFIRAPARQSVKIDAFNLHGSLLPELRGAAPINWAILRGLRRTGVTTFSLVDAMDAGDIYLQAETDIAPDETAEELRHRLADLGADLVCRTLEELAGGCARRRPQDPSKATLAPRLTKADGTIRWSAEAAAIRSLAHGAWSWPGAHARFVARNGDATDVVIARAASQSGVAESLPPGTVDRDLCVACGSGRLRVLEIQPAGKRLMTWRDFVNGHRVRPGDRFVESQP